MRRAARIGIALWLCCTGLSAAAQEGAFSFRTQSTLTPDLKTGLFRIQMEAAQPTEVFYELMDPDSVTVADARYAVNGQRNTLTDSIRAVRPWSPETPVAYTLRLTVNGKASLHPVFFYRQEKALFNGRQPHYKGVRLLGGAKLPASEFARMRAAGINALQDTSLTREQCHALGFYCVPGTDFPTWEQVRADSLLLPLKQRYQSISITLDDPKKGLCTLHNKHDFIDLSSFTLHYWVERNGKRPFWYFKRKLRFRTPAQESEAFRVKLPRMRWKGEYRLCFELRNGDEVMALEQFLLKDTTPQAKRAVKGKLFYTDGDTQIVVRGKRCEWVFNKMDGSLRSWVVKGHALLAPGTSLSLCPEKPRLVFARKEPSGCIYIFIKGAQQQRLTFYPDGAMKVEADRADVRFSPTEGPVRYFGRPPGRFKRLWENDPEGLQTETEWLHCGRITAVADAPFDFRMQGGRTWISFSGSLVLTPQKIKRNYYE